MYVAGMYITMMPLILGGILNMMFTKTSLYKRFKTPIDFGKTYKGKRIFGDNKSWIGFVSMIIFCCLTQVFWGYVCELSGLVQNNDYYSNYDNTVRYNVIIGLASGFIYMLSELPNSFVKRRIGIQPGKTDKGNLGRLFFLIDQIDSLIGVMLLLYFVSGISIGKYLFYIGLGGMTHILINLILFKLKIRKNL